MKTRNLFIVIACVLIATSLFAGVAAAKTTRTAFAGTEVQIGGADPVKYWEAGETAHLRGMTSIYWEEATDPRVSGINTTFGNMNIHPHGMGGQFWGTYLLENEGGYWAGTYQGSFGADGAFSYTAHGKGGGGYAGLQLFLTASGSLAQPLTSFEGYIQDPGQ